MEISSFSLQNFGPLNKAHIDFGDLTILVGAQATGKSMFLEMLKLYIDKDNILDNLRKYNYILNKYDSKNILETYFGEGMGDIITKDTKLKINDSEINGENILARVRTPNRHSNNTSEKVFYVPAQRIISMDDGRARNFMEFNITTPYVLRNFSELLRIYIQGGLGNPQVIFPLKNRLKGDLRQSIQNNVFHNAKVVLDDVSGQRKMKLEINNKMIPFMTWSAGQKEFLPLLLSLYCLSKVPNNIIKIDDFKVVIIEEPEMGLHPRAIVSIIMEIIDLLAMGYQVIISTHSSIFLEFAWAFNNINELNISSYTKAMCKLFDVSESSTFVKRFEHLQSKSVKSYLFVHKNDNSLTETVDITSLDPESENDLISEWGGLSWFSTKAVDTVMNAMEDKL